MSAVFEEGIAVNANDLLTRFCSFANANGWSASFNGEGSGIRAVLTKGKSFFTLRSFMNETYRYATANTNNVYGIGISGSDSINPAALWYQQPNCPVNPSNTAFATPVVSPFWLNNETIPYYLFIADRGGLYCELEIAPSCFLRFGVGRLDLFVETNTNEGDFYYATTGHPLNGNPIGNTWLGTDVFSAYSAEEFPFRGSSITHNSNQALIGSYVRCKFNLFDNWAQASFSNSYTNTGRAAVGDLGRNFPMLNVSENTIAGTGMVLPITVSIMTDIYAVSPMGIVPSLYLMNVANYNPKEVFTIGNDEYKVFPWYNKGGRSYNYGHAYRVN